MNEVVLTRGEIKDICIRIGKQITEDYKNEEKIPLVLSVLKGALPFTQDLVKEIEIPIILDYIQLSSYQNTSTTGEVKLLKDVSYDTEGRSIIVIEDVIDSGYSMSFLIKHLKEHFKAKDVKICALFDKVNAHKVDIKIDYVGKVLTKNSFLVGYGLDYNELFRNIPYVFVAKEEQLKDWDAMLAK